MKPDTQERPDYISKKIKKVSEIDLKKALKEVNQKNREFRESFRITPDVLNFTCY